MFFGAKSVGFVQVGRCMLRSVGCIIGMIFWVKSGFF